MLASLKLRDFRCFAALEAEFGPGMNVIAGANAQGKSSVLEAACVLLRLQSPRTAMLARAIRHDRRGLALDGFFGGRHLQFYYGRTRRKLVLDSVEQTDAAEYLRVGRVVWFSNEDIDLVRGAAEHRRRFLDFVAAQIDPAYRLRLRSYERALRSRNILLKKTQQRWREIEAFDAPLIEAGIAITAARARLIEALAPGAGAGLRAISGKREELELSYVRGAGEDFATGLAAGRAEDARLRQTTLGPHRDELLFSINGVSSEFASEGQQRSITLALKLGQAALLAERYEAPPLLLLDDIFGELDVTRRNALLSHLPPASQRLIATTHLAWMARTAADRVFHLSDGVLSAE
jgi:DNA replication and repair protein RecF